MSLHFSLVTAYHAPAPTSWQASSPGQEKERELATTSLKFKYLHQKKLMQNSDWRRLH